MVVPRVSTASSLRIMAFFLLILVMPKAKTMVTTAGRPSGIAATAKEIAVMKSAKGLSAFCKRPVTNTKAEMIIILIPSFLPKLSSFCCKGVLEVSKELMA